MAPGWTLCRSCFSCTVACGYRCGPQQAQSRSPSALLVRHTVPKLQCLSDASCCPSTLQHVLAPALACAPQRAVLLQVFGLSTANLQKRSSGEVAFLIRLIEGVLLREVAGLRASGVRLRFPGDRALLPAPMQSAMALCGPASLLPGPEQPFFESYCIP